MSTQKVLLIDDDTDLLTSLIRVLSPLLGGKRIFAATSRDVALEIIKAESPDVVVVDLCLNEREGVESGFSLLREIVQSDKPVKVIVLTGHESVENGVRSMQCGAASFVQKPASANHLAALITDGLKQAAIRVEYQRLLQTSSSVQVEEIVGISEEVQKLRSEVRFAASTSQPVLILGETGTGKGLCAKLIHNLSSRSTSPFVPYQPNYGGNDLVQSELFGHKKGSFTGAIESRTGLLRDTEGGTFFLDELDEVPLETQVKLLDAVQEKRVRGVGESALHSIQCRIVAAMNRPVEDALKSGKLREDFYHRVAHCIIRIPPLRERREDIPVLIDAVLKNLREEEGFSLLSCASGFTEKIQQHSWPGNVRELQAVVQGAAYRARFRGASVVVVGDLARKEESADNNLREGFHEAVEGFKYRLIIDALQRHNSNQVHAARELGLDRGTVKRISERSIT